MLIRRKDKKGVSGILILIIILALGFLTLFFTGVLQQTLPSGLTGEGESDSLVGSVLECSTESECLTFLNSEGMPDNFLQENNLKINCQNEICKITK